MNSGSRTPKPMTLPCKEPVAAAHRCRSLRRSICHLCTQSLPKLTFKGTQRLNQTGCIQCLHRHGCIWTCAGASQSSSDAETPTSDHYPAQHEDMAQAQEIHIIIKPSNLTCKACLGHFFDSEDMRHYVYMQSCEKHCVC